MAIYHCQVKPVSRGKGHSSTAGAAYRSCSKIHDERTGELHDYTKKRGLEHSEIVLSKDAVRKDIQWARDRHQLWNAAEAAEVRKDGRPAREYEVALPHELTKAQRADLALEFAQDLANRYQCAVDIAIHKPHRHGDNRNYHAHLYATTRQVTSEGLGDKTYIERSDTDRAKLGLSPGKEEITTIRERWAACANKALESAQRQERVDHRSLADQGIDRVPTRHQGPAIRGIEARGGRSIVLERIAAEEASAKLARAAELGRLEREAQQVQKEVIDLSMTLAAALEAREATRSNEREARGETTQAPSRSEAPRDVDEIRRQGRERWRTRAERDKTKESTPDRAVENDATPDRARGLDKGRGRGGPDDDFTM